MFKNVLLSSVLMAVTSLSALACPQSDCYTKVDVLPTDCKECSDKACIVAKETRLARATEIVRSYFGTCINCHMMPEQCQQLRSGTVYTYSFSNFDEDKEVAVYFVEDRLVKACVYDLQTGELITCLSEGEL